jgi:RNA polymerase sigma factor (sigma-70 family)
MGRPRVSSFEDNPDQWFADNVLPHDGQLRGWLRGRFPSVHDIDDVVQEAYSRVLRAQAQVPIESVKAFLFTTARNVALDQLRRRQVIGLDPIAETDAPSVLEERPGVADAVCRSQELELLTQAIQSLPDRCRQVLTLRKIYGLPQKEIALQLGISEHTVEAQVANGVRRCAEFLARHGLP